MLRRFVPIWTGSEIIFFELRSCDTLSWGKSYIYTTISWGQRNILTFSFGQSSNFTLCWGQSRISEQRINFPMISWLVYCLLPAANIIFCRQESFLPIPLSFWPIGRRLFSNRRDYSSKVWFKVVSFFWIVFFWLRLRLVDSFLVLFDA